MPTVAITAEVEKAAVRHALKELIFVSLDRIY